MFEDFSFFICVFFFHWKEIENANNTSGQSIGNSIPYKIMFVSEPTPKTQEDVFLVAEMQFFRRGKNIIT